MKQKFLLISCALLAGSAAPAFAQYRTPLAMAQAKSPAHCIKHRFNVCFGGTIAGPSSLFGESIAQAIPFTARKTEVVKQISVGLGYTSGTNSATINLDADDNGLPGAVLASGTATNIGEQFKPTKISIPATELEKDTRYWIAVSASGTTWMDWFASSRSGNFVIASDYDSQGWTAENESYTWWGRAK